jgi:hypothetical protein
MGNETLKQTDTQTLIEDGAVFLKFGGASVRVKALPIIKSVDWTAAVKLEMFRLGTAQDGLLQNIAKKDQTPIERLALIEESFAAGSGRELIVIRNLLMQHSPDVMTEAVVDQATADQIVSAFETLFAIENPMRRLQTAMARM